ncbi:hypothetical protein LTR62_008143 [Meristemomyces frigidus]|uniref:VanZ-like domain-containing protein n=1 Tax=Meristemomyces frigidus TaxID=1508187 RepID=A0AAN7TB96_9PEZI|nr:hypothetical protein LTR62_008143 [Meristemomyces frigidus]
MPSIRIRQPFAAAFVILLLGSAYLGLSNPKIPQYGQSDKGLHFITFFLITLTFYWVLEIPRRRAIHLTLLLCTGTLSIGSEVVQALLPNGRVFDPFDILANVAGSALALTASSWYHKRMLERKRKNKHYDIVPGQDENEAMESGEGQERDVELGQVGGEQETGVVAVDPNAQAGGGAAKGDRTDVTGELDNWDENEEDWDDGAPERDGQARDGADDDPKKSKD